MYHFLISLNEFISTNYRYRPRIHENLIPNRNIKLGQSGNKVGKDARLHCVYWAIPLWSNLDNVGSAHQDDGREKMKIASSSLFQRSSWQVTAGVTFPLITGLWFFLETVLFVQGIILLQHSLIKFGPQTYVRSTGLPDIRVLHWVA